MNLCSSSKHIAAFKTCKKPSIFCSQPSQKGSGSTPDLSSQSTLHACLQIANGREQKMLGFLQVLKPLKWQDLLEEGNNGFNVFRTGVKIHFNEKNIFGLGAL